MREFAEIIFRNTEY